MYDRYNIYRNPVRVFLNKISINFSTGYAQTQYKHELSGVYFFQDNSGQYIFSKQLPEEGELISLYSNWLNDPEIAAELTLLGAREFTEIPFSYSANPVDLNSNLLRSLSQNAFGIPRDYLNAPVNNPSLSNQTVLIDTDETPISFEGIGRGIPINLSLHYEYEKFRLGFGFMYEKQFFKELLPLSSNEEIKPYQANFKSTHYTRLYAKAGYRFYQFWSYDFVAELQIGKLNAGKQFNPAVIQRNLYTNFGISIENNWSEYFRIIIKPGIDLTNYTVTLPDGASVKHTNPTFFLQVGVSINIPDIRRSPMKSDHVQLKHLYTDPKTGRVEEVRGQPIWKKQNPKIGQNHRKLWRYKWKNRKKLNP